VAVKSTLGLGILLTVALTPACSGGDQSGTNGGSGAAGSSGFGGGQPFGGALPFGGSGGTQFGNGGTQFGNGGIGPGGVGNGGGNAGGGNTGTGGDQSGTGGNQGTGGSIGGGPDPTADSAAAQGSCTVQNYTQGVPSGQDYVNPTVYYPTNCPPPFPGVVVIPGFTEAQNAINQWGTFLASHGFVVMTVDTAASGVANTGVPPAARAQGLWEGVTTLKAENTRSGSPIAGQLDTARMVVMGHSMGGGGTMLAANAHPDLKAAIGLCPWNPGVTYPQDTVPSLFFDGSADILVAPSQSTAEYQSIPTTTQKAYVEFTGGSHFVANTPLGTAASDKIVARIGLSWLEVHVIGDSRYQQFIVKDPSMSAFDTKP